MTDSADSKDQIDGTGMSLKKGVRVSERYFETGGPAIVHSPNYTPAPPETPALISINPNQSDHDSRRDEATGSDWPPINEIPKQTMDELKSILRDSALRTKDEVKAGGAYTYLHGTSGQFEDDETNQRAFSTFKPQWDASRRGARVRESSPIDHHPDEHHEPRIDASSSFKPDPHTNRHQHQEGRQAHTRGENHRHTDYSNSPDSIGNIRFVSFMEHIKQQIARENINFVRFEATDLHGVSRSKTVPVRFFHEKAVYGVPMPRSYLELTLSPKSNEVDHATTANFSSDVLLIPDLSTFRAVAWAEQTARVICDPCTVTGNPLRTSPRLIAKQLLGQLQSMGFSLHSSFTYECCVLGAPDRIGPKTLLFPATTLLSNHDLPFFQQLVDSMYCMGADIDSIASASGPGQMEINLRPEFGISAADSAFTFRTGIKEMARKHSYIASFFTDDGLYNAGVLSHSLWDANGRRSLFHTGERLGELSEIGQKWLAGLLTHSAALSCLMSPGLGCRSHIAKTIKDTKRMLNATCGCNDNSSSFNIKSHGGRETHIDNKLGSAMANPYIVLAATVAAGLDGIRRGLSVENGFNKAPGQQKEFAIPVKLDEALESLAEDEVICSALGEPFVQYFIAMKKFEIETQELDDERNKCLEYFI